MNISSLKQIKLSPLHNLHKKYGATMTNFFGWELPVYYTGIIREHKHVRDFAGLFDVSHMCRIEIQDHEMGDLEKHLPVNMNDYYIGDVKYSFLINKSGLIIDDLLVNKINKKILFVTNASRRDKVIGLLSKIPGLKFKELINTAQIAIQGPESEKIISTVFEGSEDLNFMKIGEFKFKNSKFLISRTGYTGEDGFEIIGEKEKLSQIISILLKDKKLKLIGLGARDSLRLEAGLCLYGNEITEEINPMEAGISWVIDKKSMEFEKFYGSVSFKNILQIGIKKKRYGFVLSDRHIARSGTLVSNNKQEIRGYITSGCFSPTLNKSICMGFINTNCKEKENLYVNIRSNFIKINKINLPFVQHKYKNK